MSAGADKEEIAAELQAIAKKNKGVLTPDAVVDAARNKNSVLHSAFNWDDAAAAQSWRIEQARSLIRNLFINVTTETSIVRTVAWVRDPDMPADKQGYVATVSIASSKSRARGVLIEEFSRAGAALHRAKALAAAFNMAGDIEAIFAQVEAMRSRVEEHVE